MGRRYDVFLCHNTKDKTSVLALARKLRDAGIESWLDIANLGGGRDWLEQAAEVLRECKSCVFFVGPSGLGQWQLPEVRMAFDRHVKELNARSKSRFPVIPVVLPGGDQELIPDYLAGLAGVVFGKSLADEYAVYRLACYIRGTTPGLGSRKPDDESECPYRGLESFDVVHAPNFFGRTELTERLLEKVRTTSRSKTPSRFLAIIGASGSGKSSLARAGLVAALNRGAIDGSDSWPVVICRPGFDPCASLAVELARLGGLDLEKQAAFRDRLKDRMQQSPSALDEDVRQVLPSSDPKRRLVVLVDQFEEIFTTCGKEEHRRAFIDNLIYAAQVPQGQSFIVLAMRADFYGKCATYSNLANALSEHQQLIGQMSRDELDEAIERPAQTVDCRLEPGLVELLLNEFSNQPGSLPFLQFTLKELWNRKSGDLLTAEAYQAIGGVSGSLQRKADEVYSALSEPQKQICRRIFLRLTQPGEGTEDTRRRVPLNELRPIAGSMAEVEAVLRNLSEAETRLVTGEAENGEEFVEVAHEAIIRGWSQLRVWIETDREGLLTRRRLTEAARQWEQNARDPSFLYQGVRLLAAMEWAAARTADLNPLERDFLDASSRLARRHRVVAVSFASYLAVTLVGGFSFLTWYLWNTAVQQRLLANTEKEKAEIAARRATVFQAQADVQTDDIAKLRAALEAAVGPKPLAEGQTPIPPEILEKAKLLAARGNAEERALAMIVLKQHAEADRIIQELKNKPGNPIDEAFRLLIAEGDKWYQVNEPDKAIEPYEKALALKPDNIEARDNLVAALNSARLGDVANHRRRAIAIAEETLTLTPSDSRGWARTQNNLGTAWRDLPTGHRAENVKKAIVAYEAALRVFNRESYPADWAKTQNNLGTAWRDLPGDRAENVMKAIAACESALTVYTKYTLPVEWARTQNNLGLAWSDLPIGDMVENLRRAVAAFEASLTVYTKEAYPAEWATTQYNLGVAWRRLPTGDRTGNLKRAIGAYKAALSVAPSDLSPELRQSIEATLSWDQLLKKDFVGALSTCEQAPKEDADYLPLQLKHAHALLLLGRTEEARRLYGKYVGQKIAETGKSWEQTIFEDFDNLEKNGLKSPEFAKIREMLKAQKPDAASAPAAK